MEGELTSASTQNIALHDSKAPQWGLGPSLFRTREIDEALRFRLGDSLGYLASLPTFNELEKSVLGDLRARIATAPVSPWVFCLYSKLVAELSKGSPTVHGVLQDLSSVASLSAAEGILPFRKAGFAESWWDHFRLLLDTDRQRPFAPRAPDPEDFEACKFDIELGLRTLQLADPVWFDELQSLLRMIVLAAPASSNPADGFNGASTFFLWGAALINASVRRGPMPVVDLLVHESSHILLFGLSAEGALTRNSGEDRYASPVRRDKRPIDGIFHAAFVTTRVHLAMGRLLASGSLGDSDTRAALQRRQYNGKAAIDAIGVLERHAELTELGQSILGSLKEYWSQVPVS